MFEQVIDFKKYGIVCSRLRYIKLQSDKENKKQQFIFALAFLDPVFVGVLIRKKTSTNSYRKTRFLRILYDFTGTNNGMTIFLIKN